VGPRIHAFDEGPDSHMGKGIIGEHVADTPRTLPFFVPAHATISTQQGHHSTLIWVLLPFIWQPFYIACSFFVAVREQMLNLMFV